MIGLQFILFVLSSEQVDFYGNVEIFSNVQ